jgi:hypothetical protein
VLPAADSARQGVFGTRSSQAKPRLPQHGAAAPAAGCAAGSRWSCRTDRTAPSKLRMAQQDEGEPMHSGLAGAHGAVADDGVVLLVLAATRSWPGAAWAKGAAPLRRRSCLGAGLVQRPKEVLRSVRRAAPAREHSTSSARMRSTNLTSTPFSVTRSSDTAESSSSSGRVSPPSGAQGQRRGVVGPSEGQLRQPPDGVLPGDLAGEAAAHPLQPLPDPGAPQHGPAVAAARGPGGPLRVQRAEIGAAKALYLFPRSSSSSYPAVLPFPK